MESIGFNLSFSVAATRAPWCIPLPAGRLTTPGRSRSAHFSARTRRLAGCGRRWRTRLRRKPHTRKVMNLNCEPVTALMLGCSCLMARCPRRKSGIALTLAYSCAERQCAGRPRAYLGKSAPGQSNNPPRDGHDVPSVRCLLLTRKLSLGEPTATWQSQAARRAKRRVALHLRG